jgi:conjugal transfer pilus assembly protein TraB
MALKLPRFLAEMNPKKRQHVYFGVAIAIVFFAYLLVNQMLVGDKRAETDGPVATATKANTKSLTHGPGQQITDRESWIGGAARDLESLKNEAQERARKQDQLNRELMARLEQAENKSRNRVEPPHAPVTPPSPPPQPLPTGAYPPGTPNGSLRGAGGPEAPVGAAVSVGMLRVSLREDGESEGAKAGPRTVGATNAQDARKEVPRLGTTLPVSFVKATMLSGVDAPTGATAQKHPLPVLLRLDDLAVLPNEFRSDIKGCFAVGEATGSLSAERAYIRVIRLSCTTLRGEIVEVDVVGAVHGGDGKVGIRGRLIQKQGALLGKALLAGLAGGIAQGFAAQNVTYSVNPLGATYALDPSEILGPALTTEWRRR